MQLPSCSQVQRDIGFKHIRGHGLLDDDMSTNLGGNGASGTNLINLFSVFGAWLGCCCERTCECIPPTILFAIDFYLSVGIRPIFELSFMPESLGAS